MTLESCPFCGSGNTAFHKLQVRMDGYYGRIVCLDCHANGPVGVHDKVEKQWNSIRDAVESWGAFERHE